MSIASHVDPEEIIKARQYNQLVDELCDPDAGHHHDGIRGRFLTPQSLMPDVTKWANGLNADKWHGHHANELDAHTLDGYHYRRLYPDRQYCSVYKGNASYNGYLSWDGAYYNADGWWASGSAIIVPEQGIYRVTASLLSSSPYGGLMIARNRAEWVAGWAQGGANLGVNAVGMCYCKKNDYFEAYYTDSQTCYYCYMTVEQARHTGPVTANQQPGEYVFESD